MEIELNPINHKFSQTIKNLLHEFAETHKNDERKTFKQEWQKWMNQDDIKQELEIEIIQMYKNGFKGDVLNKMFTSARYYFRKKCQKKEKDPEEDILSESKSIEIKPKSKEILLMMDTHIREQIMNHIKDMNINNNIKSNIKSIHILPSSSFVDFCNKEKNYIANILRETIGIENMNKENVIQFVEKMKKIYKNRFYNFKSKKNKI
jgi:hypothetical protein